MKVFTAQQMRDFDRVATEEYGIPSIVLMENAALRVVEFLEAKFAPLSEKKIVILCGKGNNGGDGLAIARHLYAQKCRVTCYATHPDDFQRDAKINSIPLMSWFEKGFKQRDANAKNWIIRPITDLKPFQFSEDDTDIILDCLLGTGAINKKPDKELQVAFWRIQEGRRCGTQLLGIDLHSAVNSDDGIKSSSSWCRNDFTITFVAPKKGVFSGPALYDCGEIWVGDIGTLPYQLDTTETGVKTLDLEFIKRCIPHRLPDAHKGDAGRVLIIGGSFGMSGAVALASKAALNSGCGLCIAAIPEKVLPIFAASILEATSHPLPCDESGKLLEKAAEMLPELWKGVQVVALGPGIGRSEETQNLVRRIVRECPVPLVIDADALHALPAIAEEVKGRVADTIMTPHPGEMGVLMGISAGEVNEARFETVLACAQKYGAIVVLKGARSLVSTPEGQIFVNLTGNPGMATGGSGDVLTGTIAGLLAQLKNSEDATKLGVYLHGFAGDLAFEEKGNGLVAGDIAAHLGRALVEIPRREVERINGRLRKLM